MVNYVEARLILLAPAIVFQKSKYKPQYRRKKKIKKKNQPNPLKSAIHNLTIWTLLKEPFLSYRDIFYFS